MKLFRILAFYSAIVSGNVFAQNACPTACSIDVSNCTVTPVTGGVSVAVTVNGTTQTLKFTCGSSTCSAAGAPCGTNGMCCQGGVYNGGNPTYTCIENVTSCPKIPKSGGTTGL